MTSSSSTPGGSAPPLDFAAFVDNMTGALEASTSAASQLPDKSDMSFHRTLDRKFAKGMDGISARVLKLTNELLELAVQSPSVDTKSDGKKKISIKTELENEDVVVDHFRSSVVDIVDSLLENADSNLDEANGQKKKAAIEVKPSAVAQAGRKLPGPAGISKNMLPAHLINSRDIPKPQLAFREPVNNSHEQAPWKPTLPFKHHAMVPLEWQPSEDDMPIYSEDAIITPEKRQRDRRMRYHPYYYETTHLPYPTALFTSTPPIVPRSFEDTPFEFVDTPEQLEALTETLKRAPEIAVDLEANNIRSYFGITCLMQISTRQGDWIVDTLALRSELREHKLGGVLANPEIIKVFHGADSDIIWLQRDFDIYVVNLFDTYHACKVLEFPQFSLASLLKLYCDFEADKRYQMADWRIRPIPEEMLFYARADTHFLLYVYDSLRNALIARASRTPSPAAEVEGGSGASTPKPNPQRAIREVLEKSAETALKLYSQEPYDHEKGIGQNGWGNQIKKFGKKEVDTESGHVFRRLHYWRDTVARELDESPHHVLANHIVVELARLRPKNAVVLSRKLAKGAPLIQSRIDEIAVVIREASKEYQTASESKVTAQPTKSATRKPPAVQEKVDETPASKKAKTTAMSVDDWASLIHNKPAVRASTSSLFGNKSGKATAAPVVSKASSSSLFGSSLPGSKNVKKPAQQSRQPNPVASGFAAVQATIHGELVPERASTAEAAHSGNSNPVEPNTPVLDPEAVEFIPAAKRKNAASDAQSTSTPSSSRTNAKSDKKADSASSSTLSKAPLVNEEGVVTVKKSKNAAKKEKRKGAATTAADSSNLNEQSPAPSASTKQKKAKITPEQIPTFDYAAEPNLLDDPSAATRQTKKTKGKKGQDKKKKPSDGIDTSDFRRAPSDPTAPKSGNRSGTYTH